MLLMVKLTAHFISILVIPVEQKPPILFDQSLFKTKPVLSNEALNSSFLLKSYLERFFRIKLS